MGFANTADAPPNGPDRVAFADFELCPAHRTLLRSGTPVPIGSRAFDLLTALVERPGEVISQRDLLSRAWPDLVVQDSNLRVHIVGLRKLLGQRADGGSFITNIPGRGYSFAGAVTGLSSASPSHPAASEAPPSASLPPPISQRIIGRSADIAAIINLIEQKRFVSIVGFGGLGKTTCAVAIGHQSLEAYPGGIGFVDLSAAPAKEVATAVAAAFALDLRIDSLSSAIAGVTATRRALLILDNCEHLAEPVADFCEQLLAACPNLAILTTSRERLRATGEQLYLLAPLNVPPATIDLTAEAALQTSAVQLFMACAEAGGHTCPLKDDEAALVAEICSELDGIPLAIECVASRVSFYGIHGIADALDRAPALPWSGRRHAPQRHQSLLLNAQWSVDALGDADRIVLSRLQGIASSFSLTHAMDAIATTDLAPVDVAAALERLCDKSLIWQERGRGTVRCRIPRHVRKMPITIPTLHEQNVVPLKPRVSPATAILGQFGTSQAG